MVIASMLVARSQCLAIACSKASASFLRGLRLAIYSFSAGTHREVYCVKVLGKCVFKVVARNQSVVQSVISTTYSITRSTAP